MERPAHFERLRARLEGLIVAGVVRPTIGARLPFEQAEEAHALLRSRASVGKIVLTG